MFLVDAYKMFLFSFLVGAPNKLKGSKPEKLVFFFLIYFFIFWACQTHSNQICREKKMFNLQATKSISNRLGKVKFWRATDTVHAKQALQQARQLQFFF